MSRTSLIALVITCAAATALTAQDNAGNFTFYYNVANPPTLTTVTPLGTVTFPDTAVGKTSTVTFRIQSTPATMSAYTIMSPSVTGAGFALAAQNGLVPALGAGFGTIALNFTPATGDFSTGSLQFALVGPTGLTLNFTFTLFGRITTPRLVTSYSLSGVNNQVTIQPGDPIPFPNTPLTGTSQATIVIANTGTGPSTVDNVSLSGDAFTLSNLGLRPATVNAGNDFRFVITFTPRAAQRYAGVLSITAGGVAATYPLSGQGAAPGFTYQAISGTVATPLAPAGTLSFPDTLTDGTAKSTLTVQVTNSGNAEGQIQTLTLSGSDFQVLNPPTLPRTLAPLASFSFDIVYQPAKPGASTGRLQVGNDVFTLTGNGLGAVLSLAADAGTGPVPVPNRGTIAVPNTAVGARRSIFVIASNTGNQPVTVSSFSAAGPVFTTLSLPALPVALAPGQAQRFEVRFAPVATGAVTAALAINDQTFTLLGAGDPPSALPAVTISGLNAQTDPLQQPAATVQLATAYPSDLRGTLTLSFLSSTFADDPAIQFANGTRTINFTIPAGSTQATFDQLGRTAPFQTGTVAGTVLLAARFMTGQVDITPTAAPSISTTIPTGPPQLSSIRLDSRSGNTLQLLISGYSTGRSVSQLALTFTGAAGANLQTTTQNVDVSSAFTNWYADPSSRSFGSQFTLTLTLTITGDPAALQSVAVTASNANGTSASRSVALR